ncbi:mitotic spindle assembly checkpoint protein MAD1 [Vigna unguiculata]|uniref:Mitotic spindle assembly checkpoint protein MAD1 n=1 Tax=Vigna unguiculata TaxID=3917 RepID=A0A4D6KYE7_VIGUN|nr:mitotic spindle assembly checkpoint protein MAD1 [Vigna unguiculata]
MILRTPPPSKRPRGGGDADGDGNGQLVIYEDPPESSQEPSASEHMLCTYQCRQMVCLIFLPSRQSTLPLLGLDPWYCEILWINAANAAASIAVAYTLIKSTVQMKG